MGRGSGTDRNVVETDRSSAMGLAGNGTVRSRTSPIAEAWHALPLTARVNEERQEATITLISRKHHDPRSSI